MEIKLTREEFEKHALDSIAQQFQQTLQRNTLTPMKRQGCESDSQCYEKPDYYTIELTDHPNAQ